METSSVLANLLRHIPPTPQNRLKFHRYNSRTRSVAVPRCDVCGEKLDWDEWVAVRYACLSTCVPVLRGSHLKHRHPEIAERASKVGKPLLYGLMSSAAVAVLGLVISNPVMTAGALLVAAGLLVAGTTVRIRTLRASARLRSQEGA
jgi:hypothetical protein